MLANPFVPPLLSLRGSVKLLNLCGVLSYWSQNLGKKLGLEEQHFEHLRGW